MLPGHSGSLAYRQLFNPAPPISRRSYGNRYFAVARRLLCGLQGHTGVLHFEPTRLSLRCLRCGAETPGWAIDVQPRFRDVHSRF